MAANRPNPDNRLTGQLVSTVLESDGRIERHSSSLNGAIEGNTVTLNVGSFLGLSSVSFSGNFSGNSIILTGATPDSFTFQRAPLAEYQQQLGELHERSIAVASAREGKKTMADIRRTVSAIQQFDADADVHLSKLPRAERDYATVTSEVRAYIGKERALAGNERASIARSQLATDATQASFATDQIHFKITSLKSDMASTASSIASDELQLQSACRGTRPATEQLQADCTKLLGAVPSFFQKHGELETEFDHLEEVYKRETAAQQGLIEQGRKLE